MGKLLLPKIHYMNNVVSVVVFCINMEEHSAWSQEYDKVKLVTNKFERALSLSKELLR